jgi:acyl-CoA synthetase (AMP-forming)/AMP-acid ligase II
MVQNPEITLDLTLVDLARWQAANNPDRIPFTFLPDGEELEFNLTFRELDQRARKVAAWIQSKAQPGDRALLMYPLGLDLLIGLYSCWYAGITAVALGLPRPNAPLTAQEIVADQSQAKFVLSTAAYQAAFSSQVSQSSLQSLCWLATDQVPEAISLDDWRQPQITPESLALLVYTSGSTNDPKAVMVSQGGLVGEILPFSERYFLDPEAIFVSYAPLYHIGGLLFCCLPVGNGMRYIFMPVQSFIERPMRWLNAMSRYKAQASGCFNFGFQSCVDRTTPEERAGLDFSHWKVCAAGGERVRPDLLELFEKTFSPYGFHAGVLAPSYGSTETHGIVSVRVSPAGFRTFHLDQGALESNRVILADPHLTRTQQHVGCGTHLSNKRLILVNPNTLNRCAPDEIGEIWVDSAHVAKGYWKRPDDTKDTFQAYTADTQEGPYLRTGDMGCLIDGDLIITGRIKDMIILHGKNYYSQDLEKTAEQSHPAILPGSSAAFPYQDANEECLAIACEVRPDTADIDLDPVISAVRKAISQDQGQAVHLVALVKKGTLPRTPTGKIQRAACRTGLDSGQLKAIKVNRLESAGNAHAEEPDGYIAPRTSIERALVGIWSGVLGKQRIGVRDNFFDLGGDSLLGTQVVAQVQDVFQVELSASLPFVSPTIESMAQIIIDLRKK